ncbi:MAG: hypothetical protein ACRD8O_02570 [Bryobacteraceae bacterium]
MSKCASESRLRGLFLAAIGTLTLAALVFYAIQSRGVSLGGPISIPKLFWLCYALLFWFVLPPLIAADNRLDPNLRRMYQIFFANMALRGIIELWMMYVATNWHPYYGIAQDLFSIALIFWLLRRYGAGRPMDRLLVRNFHVVALMLCAEIGFAYYFATHFITKGQGALYYVPSDGRHNMLLSINAAIDFALALYLFQFARRWLYAPDAR